MTRSTRRARALALLVSLVLLAAACGNDDSDDAAPSGSGDDSGDVEAIGADGDSNPLADACPERIVFQTSWFPEPEHSSVYQLAGTGGEMDPSNGRYVNTIGDTGVEIEIRAGGPYLGGQPVPSIMYQDDDVMFGMINTNDLVGIYETTPVIGVVAPVYKPFDAFVFDPEVFDFTSIEEVGASDASILALERHDTTFAPFVDSGVLNPDNFDFSYDGSVGRFVAEQGQMVLMGFATNEPYRFEHEVDEWMRPVEYLTLFEAGFEAYGAAWGVKPEIIDERRECLELIVPMIQQAQVDFLLDPGPVNEEILRINDELDSFWTMDEGHVQYVADTMLNEGHVSNGDNGTVGDFDMDRQQRVIDVYRPAFQERGRSVSDDLTAEDLVTNEFVDMSIGLP